MIGGFGGGLISHAYVEERLLPNVDRSVVTPFERRLVRWWGQVARSLGPASGTRAILDSAAIPLIQLLGYQRPLATPFDRGVLADLPSENGLLIVVPWSVPTASVWREALRRGLAADRSWALVCNGRSLRVVDCTRAWARASIEFEFERLTVSEEGISTLWMLSHADRLAAAGPGSLRFRIAESDAHASRVCRTLAGGVLSALPVLTTALTQDERRRSERTSAFDQALTLVYRILFLLFAEARALVPVWNDIYRDAYSIDALARRAAQSAPGLWQGFQAISRLAHAGCRVGDLHVTAFNGRLFSPRHSPLVEQRQVPDAVMRDVLLDLATEVTAAGRRRISFHDLGVEELGSVYEQVLEHEPAREGGALVLTRTSHQRKTTGSFYTPRALTEFLVRRTLAPLVEHRTAEDILRLRIVDPSMGSGAFLVAACMFLADACEHALVRDGRWSPSDVTPADRASLRRQVAEQCLYGVDLNPTAVQLARVSLWLTTPAAGKPLTFLDHHLATGNSLIGAWLRDLSQPPVNRRPRATTDLPLLADQISQQVSSHVLPMRWRLSAPSDSLDIVKAKEHTMAVLAADDGPIARWSVAADAWCAAALWPGDPPSFGVVSEWITAATGGASALSERQLRPSLDRARRLAAGHAAFHWELAFPEVFFAADGQHAANAGFDAVIGNPPWDMLRADTGSGSERVISKAATSAALRFSRSSRCYRHHPTGHANSYQLFLDRALQLTRDGGRVGLILPSGIATDLGSASLRRHLFDHTGIDTWIGFDNRRRIFPIHRSMRFVVLATTNGRVTETLRFRSGLASLADLDRDGAAGAPLVLSRSRIESLDRDHLTIPEIPSAITLAILTTIADRVPSLGDPRGWGARFGRELNATDDRSHFVSLPSRAGVMPIVEGKQLSPFQVDLARSTHAIAVRSASRLLHEATTYSRARIAYRDVAGATNKLTLIAAMLPANVVSTHTVFCLKSDLEARSQWCLLGLLNSLVANYLVRLNVTTHVTASLMSRLPVPKPSGESRHFDRLAALAQALAATGIADDSNDYAELNAIAADLYGVTTEQYSAILDSFPLLAKSLRDRCLAVHVRATETRKHGGF